MSGENSVPLHLTEDTLKRSTIGIYPAAGLLTLVVVTVLWFGDTLGQIQRSNDAAISALTTRTEAALTLLTSQLTSLQKDIAMIQQNQLAGQQRADQRQSETEAQIATNATTGRTRYDGLEGRVRPLELAVSGINATVAAMNQTLLAGQAEDKETQRLLRELLQSGREGDR